MHEIAEFLHKVPPFDTLAEDELAAVVSAAEIEFHAANTTIHHQGAGPPDHVWVVRRGAVELIDEGRVLDLLGEGEMFGHASVLAGRPTGFQMRAHEDTLCYRIPERAIAPVLAQPAGLRYVARSLGGRFELIAREAQRGPLGGVDPANRRVADMIHGGVVMCPPGTRVQEAARRMVEAGSSAILVDLGSGGVGIVTDRDLRTRVVAAGLGPDAVVEDVMTAPARMVTADMTGSEVLLQMLDRGVRHFPVVDARRRVIGVVSDTDLMAVEARAPFLLRTDIGKAATPAAVATAARSLNETLLALEAASVAPATISRVIATVHDAIVRRLLELVEGEIGAPPSPYTWFALGSYARREAFPSSDQDNALAWAGPDDAETEAWMKELAERVVAATANAGITACRHGAVASKALFRRPIARWEDAARSWLDDPDSGEGADPGLGGHRRPPGVGGRRRRRPAGACVRRRPRPPGDAAPARDLRARPSAADGLFPQLRARGRWRAQGHARHQARRAPAHRRPGPFGGDGSGRHRRHHCLTAGGCRGRWDAQRVE